MIHIPKIKQVVIKHDGENIHIVSNGKLILSLPWQAALELSKGIRIQAKKAEEISKATRVISDQAFVTRLGLPFGLTDNPDILKEAIKEAVWSKELRKKIPPNKALGIKSQAVFGIPKLIQKRKRGG